MMELRKCCNHPYLIRGVEQAITHGIVRVQGHGKSPIPPHVNGVLSVEWDGMMVVVDKPGGDQPEADPSIG